MPHAPRSPMPDLPVVPVLGQVRRALDEAGAGVLVAPPGAGKTTLVPLALLNADWLGDRKIIVLEPRRLATRAAARRMAALLGEDDAGGTVGYRMRMDTRVGPRTRIEVVTEGVLTRMLLEDPGLASVGLLVFDEFHERSLAADLGLALSLQCRDLFRGDLRMLVMSATLDAEPVAELLGGSPVVRSEGRSHPVETRWRRTPVEGWIEPAVTDTVLHALDEEEGDVLVFLPGAGEIRRTQERLEEAGLPSSVEVHPLFGALSGDRQDRAIAPSPPGRRKVVLATSIAETSLTIEGVRVVVDSGRMRVPRFDPGTGMTRLATVTVTRDSADQRRGRAGRTAPGVCYRMWTRQADRGLVPERRPEIEEADLADLLLSLSIWGADPDELRWPTAPPEAAVAQARELLQELDALDREGTVTDHGRELAGLGVHPRLAHMLVRAREGGDGGVACDVAALLGDRDILDVPGRAPDADLRLRVEAMERARSRGDAATAGLRGHRVRRGALRRALRESDHLTRSLGVDGRSSRSGASDGVGALLAYAYPDRIGRRREASRGRYLLRNGRGARLFEDQTLGSSDWIVAADLDARGRDARIYRAAPLTEEDVMAAVGHQVERVEEVEWDGEAARVLARWREVLGAITVREGSLERPSPEALARAVLQGIRASGPGAIPWSRDDQRLRDRLTFLHGIDPERWPDRSDEALLEELEEWLLPFL
ncbi:MAG: ATP-dependent helicase HrpB, partial [Longimicrobiales bacterium]|nr:ATP-dependent helicase HrpB [Longimicrobiales bacterium]